MKLVTSSGTFGWCQPKTERVPAEDLGAARRPCSVAQKLVPGPITSDAAAAANVPRPPPYPPARWQPAAAAVLLLPPCRSATGGNSRSTVRAHQQPVQRAAMPPPASRACAALLHIALLCRADRFSPSTLSVTMRRVLCAVCPSASQTVRLHRSSCTICHCLSEAQGRLKKATNEYVILAGSLLYRTECSARSTVWRRARSMSD